MRPYAEKLNEMIANISATLDNTDDNPYSNVWNEDGEVLIIAVTSNRGLCGAFNANVIKKVNHLLTHDYIQEAVDGKVKLMCIGKKVYDHFKKRKYTIISEHNELFDNLNFDNTLPIVNSVMDDYLAGKYKKVVIVYNQFKNAAVQRLLAEQFLPIQNNETEEQAADTSEFIFEPGKEEILADLIPKALKIQFYKTVLDSNASENGARMTAMHKATDNARELLKELKLTYNKARQASITNEIIEIVGGAEALNG